MLGVLISYSYFFFGLATKKKASDAPVRGRRNFPTRYIKFPEKTDWIEKSIIGKHFTGLHLSENSIETYISIK